MLFKKAFYSEMVQYTYVLKKYCNISRKTGMYLYICMTTF